MLCPPWDAAHLADRVLPVAPFRQWLGGLPWDVRGVLVFRPEIGMPNPQYAQKRCHRWNRNGSTTMGMACATRGEPIPGIVGSTP